MYPCWQEICFSLVNILFTTQYFSDGKATAMGWCGDHASLHQIAPGASLHQIAPGASLHQIAPVVDKRVTTA